MPNTVLEQVRYHQKTGDFSAAQILDFTAVTLAAPTTVPTLLTSEALPCNVKILALAAVATGASGSGLMINISSGRSFGTMGIGTVTYTGAAGGAGTGTIVITGPFGTQTTPFAIANLATAAQAATGAANALNAVVGGQVYAVAAGAVVTLYPLTMTTVATTLGAPLLYSASNTGTPGLTVAPTVATAFTPGTAALGAPDNSYLGNFPPVFCASGQYIFPAFQPVPISANGTNVVFYPPLITSLQTLAAPATATACWDIILPCNRELTLVGMFPGESASTILYASALVVPIIGNPTQPYPIQGQWTPNNTNIGCPPTS